MDLESFPGVDVGDLEKIASRAGFRLEYRFDYRPWFGLYDHDGNLVWSECAYDASDYAFDLAYKHVMGYVPGALDKMRQLSFSRSCIK